MEWQIIVALVVAVPVILLPVLFVWYINLGSLVSVFSKAKVQKTVPQGIPQSMRKEIPGVAIATK